MSKNRISFKIGNTLQVFRLGTTTNNKISEKNEVIIQSYTYSRAQFEYVAKNQREKKPNSRNDFFMLDSSNCLDCPFSANTSGKVGLCYTHKITQFKGFLSSLKSIANEFQSWDGILNYNNDHKNSIVKLSKSKYVRFGSYGEPSKHPINLVDAITSVSNGYTGYTHQYKKVSEFSKYFMASVHNDIEANKAQNEYGYRSFISYDGKLTTKAVQCPASKEKDYKSNCSKCGLCSGVMGKGNKDVKISMH